MGIVTLVLGILAFIPYWMWRKRLVFILKIVHYFQQYEEDGKKEHRLVPSLGHLSPVEGYKLNLLPSSGDKCLREGTRLERTKRNYL